MSGANFMDELDCGSFFNHMDDDLIEFPVDNGCNDFHSIWTDNSNILPLSDDPIFFGGNSKTASDLSPELSVPREEIAHLDWLSNFLEDSFAGQGLTINNGAYPFKESAMARHQFQISSPVSVLESSSSSTTSSSSSCSGGKVIPLNPTQHGIQRARSKRPRPATFIPRRAIHLVSPTPEPLLIPVPVLSSGSENLLESHSIKTEQQQKKKKRKLKPSLPSENAELNQNQNQNQPRKCLHCEITKTPQWRAGPMGPKTLCNACGVRYKSGRLFPEYRPAASPTFVPSIHSNSHKKVAEMRAKGTENAEPYPQLIPNSNASADHQ